MNMQTPSITLGIADDHPIIRNGLADFIRVSPLFRIMYLAENGRHLIEQIESEGPPDICILDINMPVMDGYEAITYLKAKYPQLKFLVFTMVEKEYGIIRMLKKGANGYMLKCRPVTELFKALSCIYNEGYYYSDIAPEQTFRTIKNIRVSDFSPKEIEFLKLCCSEMGYKEIADKMCVSIRTVHDYHKHLAEKTNISTRLGQALFAVQTGIVRLEN